MIYYFAYGSNLLEARFKKHCPSAKRITVGKINNYRLDFGNHFSQNWNGHVATIVPEKNSYVEGVVWKIPDNEIKFLDDQEDVHRNTYNTLFVPVYIGNIIRYCYCYQLTDLPCQNNHNLPSKSYLETIIKGAKESNLSNEYLEFLSSFRHNNRKSKMLYPDV